MKTFEIIFSEEEYENLESAAREMDLSVDQYLERAILSLIPSQDSDET